MSPMWITLGLLLICEVALVIIKKTEKKAVTSDDYNKA